MTGERGRVAAGRRRGYALAAAGALAVTLVFATVGDGVEVAAATGPRRVVVDLGHTAVWALLTAAFGTAAVRSGWNRLSNGLALAAGATYGVFLLAVLIG